jgi:hypothetical protein
MNLLDETESRLEYHIINLLTILSRKRTKFTIGAYMWIDQTFHKINFFT